MKHLNISPKEFLSPLFDPADKVCLRVFDDRKAGTFSGAKLECEAGRIDEMVPALHKHNEQNRGIYFVVNFGGHEDADITRINAQFVECDELSIEAQLAQIEAFPLPPSLIVRTKKSLHTYWLMRDAKVADFRRVQKRLIAQFHGDKACVNESRVFRLPGFNHCKGEPFPVECIRYSPELRYTQAELEEHLPVVEDEPAVHQATAPKGTRAGLELVRRQCLFMQHCRENAATLSEHDWYAMISNLAVFEDGDKAIHALSKDYPTYSYRETQEKISHFMFSGTKPMTCQIIAEKGFACPKLTDGSCPCRSPAALCYQPLDIDTMRALLTELPFTGNTVNDMQTAQAYTKDFLYNVDQVIATAFIETELKQRFGFKANEMKPLLALHRSLYRSYQETHEMKRKREEANADLPAWYEITERGGCRFFPGILADHLAKTEHIFYAAKVFHFYRDGVYVMDDDMQAALLARSFMQPRYATMLVINDTVSQWRLLIQKPMREINANPYIINVRNGLYNVLDDSFAPHTPACISTVQIHAAYMPGSECPVFQRFIHDLLDEPEVHLMQEIMGYFLVPINKAQKSFLLKGAQNAGKSTLLSVVQDILLGKENVSNVTWQDLGERFRTAEIYNKLANIFADLPTKNVTDNSMFKAISGEDYITAERKNKDPFNFRPFARLMFSCNKVPRNYGDRSEGFFRRLIIIPVERIIPAEKRDSSLLDKMALECDGILMWALDGLRRLMANNYVFSETALTNHELQRYRVESNSALSFADECCQLLPDVECSREEMFLAYREYCTKNGLKAMSQTTFNREIEAMSEDIHRGLDKKSRRKIWVGIRLEA
ncbi:phage/plasmid primase, P4 family [Eubacteriales bacterium OttesenSCG-928-A19]|nr:phage/plasmid primase, P4 family [Eubacteriales bacterium OttesenSCG-928-A19]